MRQIQVTASMEANRQLRNTDRDHIILARLPVMLSHYIDGDDVGSNDHGTITNNCLRSIPQTAGQTNSY